MIQFIKRFRIVLDLLTDFCQRETRDYFYRQLSMTRATPSVAFRPIGAIGA